jgi:hypothetical protein
MKNFLGTLRFHYMGMGALFACALRANPDRLLNSWVTAYWFQALTVGSLLYYYLIGLRLDIAPAVLDPALAFFYAALIINVSLGPRRWIDLE